MYPGAQTSQEDIFLPTRSFASRVAALPSPTGDDARASAGVEDLNDYGEFV